MTDKYQIYWEKDRFAVAGDGYVELTLKHGIEGLEGFHMRDGALVDVPSSDKGCEI